MSFVVTKEKQIGRIILGSGRSGTTWVQDALSFSNNIRPIFEPLHHKESEEGRRFAYSVMTPGDHNESLERFFLDVSEGRISSVWMNYRAPRHLLYPHPRKFTTVSGCKSWLYVWRKYFRDRAVLRPLISRRESLIKCIRANLMAGWISQTLGFKTVFVLRHPCATVESQFRWLSAWDPSRVGECYRKNDRLHEVTDGRYLSLLNSRLSMTEALTLNWVIENQGPVESAPYAGYTVMHYERLLLDPANAWASVCQALELKIIPGALLLNAPSQTTYHGVNKDDSDWREPRWRKTLEKEQLAEIQRILDLTECDLYDISSEKPSRLLI